MPITPKKKRTEIIVWNFIKKYPWFVSSIILTIGGIHQFYYLWKIGLPFLRFFSVTQLLTDGLIVMGYIAIALLLILFSTHLISLFGYDRYYDHLSINESRRLKLKDSWNVKLTYFASVIILIIFGNILNVDLVALAKNLFENPKELFSLSTYSSNIFITSYFLFIIFLLLGLLTLKENSAWRNKFGKSFVVIFFPIYFLTITNFAVAYEPINPFDISSTLNHNKLVVKLESENPDHQVKIIYFNDKYIFSQLISQKDTLINISSMNNFIESKNIEN